MLVNCAAYQDGRKLGDIDVGQISDYLQSVTAETRSRKIAGSDIIHP